MSKTDKNIKAFIETGSDVAGAATGSAIGFLAGGPIGAAIGAGLGHIVATSLQLVGDLAQRTLSHRETVRVAGTAALAIDRIRQRIEDGDKPRGDGFFETSQGSRPKAEELFEGALLKAKSEHEEKKLPLFANFFSSIVFRSDISADDANWMLQLLERLNFSHFSILYAFYQIGEQCPWKDNKLSAFAASHPITLAQIAELKSNSLLLRGFWGDYSVKITDLGRILIELIRFNNVVDKTFEDVAWLLDSENRDQE